MRRHHGLVSFLLLVLLSLALFSQGGVLAQETGDPDPTDPNDPTDPSPSPSPSPDSPSPSPNPSLDPSPSPSPQPSAPPTAGPPSPSPSQHPTAPPKGNLTTPAGPVPTNSHIIVGFKGVSGPELGTSAYAIKETCLPLNTTSLQNVPYAFGDTSDKHAALNLYQDLYCQIAVSSAVGYWPNTGVTANVAAIRYEGKAPNTTAPGTLSPSVFPPGMGVHTPVPTEAWVMDPSKGKVLVGVVAAVLGVGVALGVYQVYEAAQYVAPPKAPKQTKGKSLYNKKVKREDAFFRKPGYEPVSLQGGGTDSVNASGKGRDSSSKTSSRELLMAGQNKFKQTPHQLEMQQKYRLAKSLNSQYDMAGNAAGTGTGTSSPLVPISHSSTSSGRTLNRNSNNTSSAAFEGPSAIMMQERLQKQDNRFSTGGVSVASSGMTFPAPPMTPPSHSSSFAAPASSGPTAVAGNRMGSSGSSSSPFTPPPLPSSSRPRVDDTPMLIVDDDVIQPASSTTTTARTTTAPATKSNLSDFANLIDFRDLSASSSPRPVVSPPAAPAPGGYVPRTQYSTSPPPTPNHTRPISGSQFQYPSQ
ncbi:hypothetical protein EMPS_05920 [Entomortierella parvispora]|uniref:Mid2 domain-containing protein n=1 Tax=Entomortierella parvispora TaxID=205924 RepID=A0A9P3HC11_9FUNG|nr:hypothetical protein EMPS_05920 [Entomortierella parvispora]